MNLKKYQKTILTKKNKKIILRFPERGDVNKLLQFGNKLVEEDTYILLTKRLTKKEEVEYLEKRLKAIEEKKRISLLAIYNGKIIGNGGVDRKESRQKHIGELDISVSKEFRDEGVGSVLMEELITLAKNFLKLKILFLRVFGNNKRGIYFYGKLGFRECGRIPKAVFYKGKYEDEVIMYQES